MLRLFTLTACVNLLVISCVTSQSHALRKETCIRNLQNKQKKLTKAQVESCDTKVRIMIEDSELGAALSQSEVAATLVTIIPQAKVCYEKQLNIEPNLEGTIALQWQIDSKGIAKSIKLQNEKTTLTNRNMTSCLISAIRTAKFLKPRNGIKTPAMYPIQFKPI